MKAGADMEDPYKRVWEDIAKALTKESNMILWLAKRTLTVKEFGEFIDEFSEKKDDDEIIWRDLKTKTKQ